MFRDWNPVPAHILKPSSEPHGMELAGPPSSRAWSGSREQAAPAWQGLRPGRAAGSWGRPSHCQPQDWLLGPWAHEAIMACNGGLQSLTQFYRQDMAHHHFCLQHRQTMLSPPTKPTNSRSKKTAFAYTDQGSKGDWQTLPSALTLIRCLPGKLSLIQMHHPSNGALSISFTVTDIPLFTIICNSFHPSSFCCCPHLPVSCLTWWVIPTDLFPILVCRFKPKLDGPCEGCK